MTDLTHLFVPYELAVKLKEMCFDDPCFALYKKDGSDITPVDYEYYRDLTGCKNSEVVYRQWFNIAAPLHQQVVDWLRETKGIKVYCTPQDNGWMPYAYLGNHYESGVLPIVIGLTYYEALNKAIQHALTLISHEATIKE
jgi:hypothetical protein